MDDPHPVIVRSIGGGAGADEVQHAVRARPVPLTGTLAAEDAFRLTLFECLAQISANAGVVRSGRDGESLHQLRVGLRRLQVALSAFGEELRAPGLKELRGRAKAIASRLGPARDLDVFIAELMPGPAKEAGEGFEALKARAEAAREIAWNAVVECIASADFGRFLDDCARIAERRSLRWAKPQRVRRAAGRVLDENLVCVRKRGRKAKSRAERDFHRLRIALKKLRYGSEFFAPLYRKKAVNRYLMRLKALQDCLGSLNDIAHLRTTLAQLLADESQARRGQDDLLFAAGQIDGWHRARALRLTKSALRHWRRFKHLDAFWR